MSAPPAGDHRSRLLADVVLHDATATAAAAGGSANDDGASEGGLDAGDGATSPGGGLEQRDGGGGGGRPLAAHEAGARRLTEATPACARDRAREGSHGAMRGSSAGDSIVPLDAHPQPALLRSSIGYTIMG